MSRAQEKVKSLPEQIIDLNLGHIATVALLYAYEKEQEAEAAKRQSDKHKTRADIDDLTGLYRRDGFIEAASNPTISQSRVKRGIQRNSLLMIDIDDFKHINDTLGHNAGDAVLKELAGRMKSAVREDDIIGRWGGEEFVVFLPETPEAGALGVAEKLREATDGLQINGMDVNLSIGAAEAPEGNLELGLQYADESMYAAKHAGKDQAIGHTSLQNSSNHLDNITSTLDT